MAAVLHTYILVLIYPQGSKYLKVKVRHNKMYNVFVFTDVSERAACVEVNLGLTAFASDVRAQIYSMRIPLKLHAFVDAER